MHASENLPIGLLTETLKSNLTGLFFFLFNPSAPSLLLNHDVYRIWRSFNAALVDDSTKEAFAAVALVVAALVAVASVVVAAVEAVVEYVAVVVVGAFVDEVVGPLVVVVVVVVEEVAVAVEHLVLVELKDEYYEM